MDNSDAQEKIKDLEKEIKSVQSSITSMENKKSPMVEQARQYGAELDAAKEKLESLKAEQSKISGLTSGTIAGTPDQVIDAFAQQAAVNESVKQQEAAVSQLQKQWDGVNSKIDAEDAKIREAKASIESMKVAAGQLEKNLVKSSAASQAMATATESAQESARKFALKLKAVVRRALVFTVISQAAAKLREMIAANLKTNEEYTAQLAQMKAAWLTAFQPVWEVIVPALLTLMRILTAVANVISSVFSFFSGKSTSEMAENAEALYEERDALEEVGGAASDAGKSLAGFDEINKLSDSSGGGGGGTSGTVAPDFNSLIQEQMGALEIYVGGAMLALGAILTFTGANIPLGIALMALGAMKLASALLVNWDSMPENIKSALTKTLGVLGTAAFVIGAILTFTGAHMALGIGLMVAGAAMLGTAIALNWGAVSEALKGPIGKVVALASGALLALGLVLTFSGAALPLGIALMVLGAAGLATTAALNWDSIVTALQGPVGKVVAIASGALLALGLILALSGVGLPLGIALIAAGAAGLVTVSALNWNAILDRLKGAWNGIKSWWQTKVAQYFTLTFWQDKFSSIAEALEQKIKDGINAAIALFNSFISWVNEKLHISWDPVEIAGQEIIPGGDFQLLTIPQIPMLAQGAVIPPNREFLAVLGDQKSGTNVEAPLSTIEQAVENVLARRGAGSGEHTVILQLDRTQLGKVVYRVNNEETQRIGVNLALGGGI